MNELHLFAGAGGGILGGILLGHTTVCAVEIQQYPREILIQRQKDGLLPRFPIWNDIKTFDGNPWRGIVDVVCGGFPCQDISAAGKGAGIEGERSGLWKEMARVVREVQPRFVFVENSPNLTSRGLGTVLGDLATMGFDAQWGVFGADDAGAPHQRKRIWILAHTRRKHGQEGNAERMETHKAFRTACPVPNKSVSQGPNREAWKTEPSIDGMVNGMANGMDRLTAIGNGQVPAVAALAFTILLERLTYEEFGKEVNNGKE